MSTNLRNIIIAGAVIAVTAFLLGAFGDRSLSSTVIAMVLGGFTYFLLQSLSGNKSVDKVADVERDRLLAAAPPSGQALVYIYREGFRGRLVGWNVTIDGRPVAQLKAPRFTRVALPPGEHLIVVTPPGFAGTQSKAGSLTTTLSPDEVAIISVKLNPGMMVNQVDVERVPDTRAALTRLSKIPMVAPEAWPAR